MATHRVANFRRDEDREFPTHRVGIRHAVRDELG